MTQKGGDNFTNGLVYFMFDLPTYQPTYLPTNQPTNLSTNMPTYSSTHAGTCRVLKPHWRITFPPQEPKAFVDPSVMPKWRNINIIKGWTALKQTNEKYENWYNNKKGFSSKSNWSSRTLHSRISPCPSPYSRSSQFLLLSFLLFLFPLFLLLYLQSLS